MSGYSYRVPPCSWQEIADYAETFRRNLGLKEIAMLPIMDIIEHILDNKMNFTRLEVAPLAEMGTAEGYTCPTGTFIRLREDVYEGACNNKGRDRFTAAHECGHLFLHTNISLARVANGEKIKAFEDSEAQANQFAAEILMPASFFLKTDNAAIVANRHGVSLDAANNRLNYLRKKGMLR